MSSVQAPKAVNGSDSTQHNDGALTHCSSSSMLGVGVSVVVVGLALVSLPFSYVTLLMAALAGAWWMATSSEPTQMSHPSGPDSAAVQQQQPQDAGVDSTSVAASTHSEPASSGTENQEDEQLGLDPPNYGTGRSVTGKRSSLAAALPAKATSPAPPGPVAATTTQPQQQGRAAATAAVPPVAADASSSSSNVQVPGAVNSFVAPPTATGPQPASSSAPVQVAAAAPKAPQPAAPAQQQQEPEQPAAAPAALTGSAAILAKLRQQRASSSVNASSGKSSASSSMSKRAGQQAKVMVLYASQTGTGQEIARSIHAECAAKGMPAEVMSMNELGFDNLRPDKTPVVVVVASSTGDGDPPDNAAAAFVAMKKSWPADRLAGLRFTVLGLGDSNYTRFMHVPRVIKSRLQDLGGQVFYPCAEADEVDGLEATVDPWVENILGPVQTALQQVQQQQQEAQQPQQQQESTATLPALPEAGDAGTTAGDKAAAAADAAQAGTTAEPAAAASRPASAAAAAAAAEGTASSTSTSAAAVAATAAAVAQTAAVSANSASSSARSTLSPAASAPVELVDGLAPKGVDLKGAPPLAPCRITLNQQVSAAVAEAVREKEQHSPSREQMGYRDPTGAYSAATPFWATVADAKLLTAEWSDRTVLHVELDLADSGMRFAAGDAVGVLPCNDPALVAALLARLGVDGDAVFEVQPADDESSSQGLLTHIAWPCTFRHAFTTGTDITSVPRKSLLRLLAEHCSDEDEQRTLMFFTSRAGREAYASEITAAQPSLLDLLRRFPSCKPPVHALLDALPPLAARMYSLTNAPVAGTSDDTAAAAGAGAGKGVPGAVGPKRAQFALSVVEFETQYGTRRGVATTWLAKLCRPWLSGQVAPGAEPSTLPEAWVPLFLRHAAFFKPPADLSKPMIMIGPGTGVAPFRGFLQQRLADMQAAKVNVPGQAVLYFGCRKPEEDYLYEQDWQEFLETGALSKLRVAFSRAQANKVYVQHLLKEDGAEVAKLIAGGAHVYVCGDGAAMAKDVHAALQAILRDQLGMSEAQAGQELTAMTKEGRYVRDIWS